VRKGKVRDPVSADGPGISYPPSAIRCPRAKPRGSIRQAACGHGLAFIGAQVQRFHSWNARRGVQPPPLVAKCVTSVAPITVIGF
jgi:hypothetical protein